jgi:hypothetical protein
MSALTINEIEQAKNEIRNKAYEFALKVYPIFKNNNWTWVYPQGERIPDTDDIFFLVCSLRTSLIAGEQTSAVSSGRIHIQVTKYSDDEISILISLRPEWLQTHIEKDKIIKSA